MNPPTPLYLEDFYPGFRLVTSTRTITESDVMAFASLTGDDNPLHTDADFARTTPFGQRVAHGLLGLAVALGLATRGGLLAGSVLAFREIVAWKFMKPVFFGDTIHAELEVSAARELPGINAGLVDWNVRVKNQRDEVVMKGIWRALILKKGEQTHGAANS